MLVIALLLLGIVSRLLVHLPNFTPVIAVALFGAVYLNKSQAILIPVLFMAVSDIFLGYHDTMPYTWGSMALIGWAGLRLRENKSFSSISAMAVAASLLFFIITNFGAWLSLYPRTWSGLQTCYWAAIPFFRNTLISTFVYSLLLFGGYELTANKIRHTRWAKILLTT